jgi:hypothetical protein
VPGLPRKKKSVKIINERLLNLREKTQADFEVFPAKQKISKILIFQLFANVLESDGDTCVHLFGGRSAGISLDSKARGQGWRHYHSSRIGFGEAENTVFTGKAG